MKHLPCQNIGTCKRDSYLQKRKIASKKQVSCPHVLLCGHLDIYKNTFAQCPFATNRAFLQFRTPVKKQGKQKYTIRFCTPVPTCTFKIKEIDLKKNVSKCQSHICFRGIRPNYLCPSLKFSSQRVKFIMRLHRYKQATSVKHNQEEKIKTISAVNPKTGQ